MKLTAYADDVTVFIRSEDDVKHLFSCLNIFQSASSARVNWEKTDTLLLGHWSDQSPPQLPYQRLWNKEGVKILGLFFGTEQYMKKNWEGLVEKDNWKAAEMEMDPSPALLQRQSISSEQSCCLNAVASSDSIGSSKRPFVKTSESFCRLLLGWPLLAPPWSALSTGQ